MKSILMFAVGVAAGAAVAWKLAKDKYSKISLSEINEFNSRHSNEVKETPKEDTMTKVKVKEKDKYTNIIKDAGYTSKYTSRPKNTPYVISPEEFGEKDDYDRTTLFHYTDGTLTDDNDEPVDNVEATVGNNYVLHFGEYEDDTVFIRNDRMKTDFEILRQIGKFPGGNS